MNEIEILQAMNYEIQSPVHWTKEEQDKTVSLAITALTEKLNGGWISVEDSLPTIPIEKINEGFHRIAVLVTSKNQDMAIIRRYDIVDKLFYDDFGFFGNVDEDVIAWQPLPEKYKEEE